LDGAPSLQAYAPLPAAKGDFLFRAGRMAEARIEFERAAALSRNGPEREFLLKRAEECRE
jgi:predicted RNA polymerase sigma factor